MMQVVIERGENAGRAWPLLDAPGVTTIGRGASNSVVLPDSQVSRLHCQIEPSGPDFILVDKSTNGVLVEGRKVQGQIALKPGMRIQVGNTVLRVEQAVAGDQTLVEGSRASSQAEIAQPAPAPGRLRQANLIAIAAGLAAGLVIVGVVIALALTVGQSAPATASQQMEPIVSNAVAGPTPVEPSVPVTVTASAPMTPTVAPTVEATVAPAVVAPVASPVITGTVTALAGLNVRAEPRVNAAVLYQVKQGEEVTIVGRSELGDWLMIQCRSDQAADVTCWLANYLVAISGSMEDAAVVSQ